MDKKDIMERIDFLKYIINNGYGFGEEVFTKTQLSYLVNERERLKGLIKNE